MAQRSPRDRDPDETRGRILEAAFAEFYRNGFQAGNVAAIVERAGVTKGALYHHFGDKAALGYAVLDEVIREPILDAYLGPLEGAEDDPLAVLQDALRRRPDFFAEMGITFGCPLNNLIQEMSPLDEGFRTRLAAVIETWTDGFHRALATAQERGFVRADVDTRRVASFAVAAIEGAFGTAKNADSVDALRANLETLADFMETLRPGTGGG